MTLLGSLRVRSPSPALPPPQTSTSQPLQPTTARAPLSHTSTPCQPPVIPSISLVSATPVAGNADDSFTSEASSNSRSSEGGLAPPLQPSRKSGTKRVLVPKKTALRAAAENVPPQELPVAPSKQTATLGRPKTHARSITISDPTMWNAGSSYKPPTEWEVVPPPPPPRTVAGPHQFASARRANSIDVQSRKTPEPVAILPVKTEDGSSRTGPSRAASLGRSSVRTTGSVRSNGTVRTQKENTLKVYNDNTILEGDVVVKKKKSRLALDLGWALGDKTNTQNKEKDSGRPATPSASRPDTPTLGRKGSLGRLSLTLKPRPSLARLSSDGAEDRTKDKENAGKEKWKWSLGLSRGRKEAAALKDMLPKRAKSPSPPPAVRNLPVFSSSTGPLEYTYRSPSLEDYPPAAIPRRVSEDGRASIPSPTVRLVQAPSTEEDSPRSPFAARPPSVARSHYRTYSAGSASFLGHTHSRSQTPTIRFAEQIPEDDSPPDSPTVLVERLLDEAPSEDSPLRSNTGSLAVRAMRSVRSMAKIFVGPDDSQLTEKPKRSRSRTGSKSRASMSGIEHAAQPTVRRASHDASMMGAASSDPVARYRNDAKLQPVVAQPIVSSSLRERMSSVPLGKLDQYPSVETFGTLRFHRGRSSQDTKRTISTGSSGSGASGSSAGSTTSAYTSVAHSIVSGHRNSGASSGGRLSLLSALSAKPPSNPGTVRQDSTSKKTAKKRGSLANLFDMAANMKSTGSIRSSRGSKTSVDSTGSRLSGSSGSASVSHEDGSVGQTVTAQRIKLYHALRPIPASPTQPELPEDPFGCDVPAFASLALGPDVVLDIRRNTPEASPTRKSAWSLESTPEHESPSRRRPMSERLLSAFSQLKLQATASSDEGSDVPISVVNAATNDLSDLINRLDLSATPDATPIKSFTPRRARTLTEGHSPVPSLPDTIKKWKVYKESNLFSSLLPSPTPELRGTPSAAAASTFGRRAVRPDIVVEPVPIVPLSTRSQRFSAKAVEGMADDESVFDSPLKNRSRKASKGSTGTMLSMLDRPNGKASLGPSLSPIGGKRGTGTRLSSGAVGDVSMTACGHRRNARFASEEPVGDEDDDSDIPEELQEILSSKASTHSEASSDRTADANARFCDISIPTDASALMNKSNLDSMLEHPSQSSGKSSTSSVPPGPAPARPLPARPPAGSRWSAWSSQDGVSLAQSNLSSASACESATIGLGLRVNTAAIHEGTGLHQLDEEDSPASSEDDHIDKTDHTGKTAASFDFTRELNKLNQGGSRMSFVQQLESTFNAGRRTSKAKAAQDVPPVPTLKAGSRDASFGAFNPDSTMYAMANLDLSLVHPTKEPKTSTAASSSGLAPPTPRTSGARYTSLSDCLEASMAALASMDLSIANANKPRPHSTSVGSDRAAKRHARIALTRAYRDSSILTTSSFGSIRNPGVADPFNYGVASSDARLSAEAANARARDQSTASIPSISSYGVLLNSGGKNPFGYDMTRNYEDTSLQVSTSSSSGPEVARRQMRDSVGSDQSSFYFNSRVPTRRANWKRDSLLSFTSPSVFAPSAFQSTTQARPRPDSILSTGTAGHGNAVISHSQVQAVSRDDRDVSRDSIVSILSTGRLGRPGLGDKMFETHAGAPLYSIEASPTDSQRIFELGRTLEALEGRASFGSGGSRFDRSSVGSSMFDKTHSRPTSISSDSVFGADTSQRSSLGSLHQTNQRKQFRPLSMFSTASGIQGVKDDDTMVSMLGGDHTRIPRGALGSPVDGSPCVRVEKRRKRVVRVQTPEEEANANDDHQGEEDQHEQEVDSSATVDDSVPSLFADLSIVLPRADDLNTEADDSNISQSTEPNIFDGIVPVRSSQPTLDTASVPEERNPFVVPAAAPDTPPLSVSTFFEDSQSDADMEHLKAFLKYAAPPSVASNRFLGKRWSQASRLSRISLVESIAEEVTSADGSLSAPQPALAPPPPPSSFVAWDAEAQRDSWRNSVDLTGELTLSLRQYFALQAEIQEAVEQSQNAWSDTEFSRFALASFCPPENPSAIQELIQYSQKTYTPLPLELRVRKRRSRVNSRPSPYPKRGPTAMQSANMKFKRGHSRSDSMEEALACISPYGSIKNGLVFPDAENSPPPVLGTVAPLSPFALNFQSQSQSPIPSLDEALAKAAPVQPQAPAVKKPGVTWAKNLPFGKSNASKEAGSKETLGKLGDTSALKNSAKHVHSSTFAKENAEKEARGLLSGPNGTLRLARARPPRRAASRVGLSTTFASLRV